MLRVYIVVFLFYISLEWTNATICPHSFRVKIKFGANWKKFTRNETCSTDFWCVEATIQDPAIIKSPRQRDGMIEGKMSMCANDETNAICDEMLDDGLRCKNVSKVSIGEDGQELHGRNISLCCSRETDMTTECQQNFSISQKNRQDEWEMMVAHETRSCMSTNGYCIKIDVKDTAVVKSFGGQRDFEIRGKLATCSRMHGSPIVNCDSIGEGCKIVNELKLGEEGQMLEGETEICCCKGKLCNA